MGTWDCLRSATVDLDWVARVILNHMPITTPPRGLLRRGSLSGGHDLVSLHDERCCEFIACIFCFGKRAKTCAEVGRLCGTNGRWQKYNGCDQCTDKRQARLPARLVTVVVGN
jgi:hypothetical protein